MKKQFTHRNMWKTRKGKEDITEVFSSTEFIQKSL